MDMNKEHTAGSRTLRNSKQRQTILDLVAASPEHMSAEEIYQQARLSQPNISLGTVYRNLDTLSEQGLIIRSSFADGKARYEMAGLDHHHHLICLQCGEIRNLVQCPMAPSLEAALQEADFQAVQHQFEIYGYCRECQHRRSSG